MWPRTRLFPTMTSWQQTCHVSIGDPVASRVGLEISPINLHLRCKCAHSERRLSGLGEHTAPIRLTRYLQHIGFPPLPQMKEESPCAVNALRTALRIYNKRRIIDTTVRLNQIRRPSCTENKKQHISLPPRFPWSSKILTIPSFSAACTAILSRMA